MEIKQTEPSQQARSAQQPSLFYRITALWAMSEAFLGGVLHALHLPGTGLFVGGASVICISLLYYYCPSRSVILKATVLVILIKGMLSPHSPPAAYLAVAIQGGMGYLLLQSRNYYKASCLVLGVITQLQSALQRLVVMLVVFGADLYQVAHEFVNYILKKAGMQEGEYVLYIVLVYIGAHALMGILVGWLAGRLPGILERKQLYLQQQLQAVAHTPIYNSVYASEKKANQKRKLPLSIGLLVIGMLLALALYLNITPEQQVFTIITRAILIYIVWSQLLLPLFSQGIREWSQIKRSLLAKEIEQLLAFFPFVKQQVQLSWRAVPATTPFYKKLLAYPPLCLAAVMQSPS